MKRLLPSAGEIGVFALLAVALAVVVTRFSAWDLWLALMAMPLFVGACVMGLRKNGHFTGREVVPVPVETTDESV